MRVMSLNGVPLGLATNYLWKNNKNYNSKTKLLVSITVDLDSLFSFLCLSSTNDSLVTCGCWLVTACFTRCQRDMKGEASVSEVAEGDLDFGEQSDTCEGDGESSDCEDDRGGEDVAAGGR